LTSFFQHAFAVGIPVFRPFAGHADQVVLICRPYRPILATDKGLIAELADPCPLFFGDIAAVRSPDMAIEFAFLEK
jgi:hypothetical protein